MPGVASYDPRNNASTDAPTDTITSKAARVLGLAREIRDRAHNLRSRACRPVAEKAQENVKPPTPEHVIFSLEEAEHELNAAISLLSEVQQSI